MKESHDKLLAHTPVSRLLWLLLARARLRLRWLALRDWEKDDVESMVFRRPRTLVGYRNCVYDTVCQEIYSIINLNEHDQRLRMYTSHKRGHKMNIQGEGR